MDAYVAGEPYAVAIIEAWNPARSEVRRQTTRYIHSERRSTAVSALHGVCLPNANLDELLASWHDTRSPESFGTLILSARPRIQKICRDIARSDDITELCAKVEEVLLKVVNGAPGEAKDIAAYLYGTALHIHKRDTKIMERFVPLTEAENMTTDDAGDDLELWRERPASAIEDPAVATVAQMLLDGLTVNEICQKLGITRSGVYKRVTRYLSRQQPGTADLMGCADELHNVQTPEEEWKIFSEMLSTFGPPDALPNEGRNIPLVNTALLIPPGMGGCDGLHAGTRA